MANYTVTITETLIASDKITIDVIRIAVLTLILTTILTILVSTFLHLLHKTLDKHITKRYWIATIVAGALLAAYLIYLCLSQQLILNLSICR
jgi:uncharacterized membrane protein YfcA